MDHTRYRKCQRCGEAFDEEKLRYCEFCGLILCPLCQMAHECKEPEMGQQPVKSHLNIPQAYYACNDCGGLFLSKNLYESRITGELLCHHCYHKRISSNQSAAVAERESK